MGGPLFEAVLNLALCIHVIFNSKLCGSSVLLLYLLLCNASLVKISLPALKVLGQYTSYDQSIRLLLFILQLFQ